MALEKRWNGSEWVTVDPDKAAAAKAVADQIAADKQKIADIQTEIDSLTMDPQQADKERLAALQKEVDELKSKLEQH